jgi:hypothetical protein
MSDSQQAALWREVALASHIIQVGGGGCCGWLFVCCRGTVRWEQHMCAVWACWQAGKVLWSRVPQGSALHPSALTSLFCSLQDLYHPFKLNIAAIGNIVSQLHVHVTGRLQVKDTAVGRLAGQQVSAPCAVPCDSLGWHLDISHAGVLLQADPAWPGPCYGVSGPPLGLSVPTVVQMLRAAFAARKM